MLELISNLREIQSARNNMKTALENKGMTVTNDIRTYAEAIANIPSGSGSGDVKLFETEQAMQADPSPSEGDLAVIYREELTGVTEESEFDSCTFPNTVVLDEAFSGEIYGSFRAVDQSVMFDGMMDMSSTAFRFDGYADSGEIRVEYESEDGITYTRTDSGEELQEFGTTIKWKDYGDPFNDVIGNFMKMGGMVFEGLYEYKSNEYVMTKNQLNATPDYVYEKTFYGKNGVESGTLGIPDNSFADASAAVYTKVKKSYDVMTPRVLTDSDKDINKNIYVVPSNANGVSLLDTSSVTNMDSLFQDCKNLSEISSLNTSNATSMHSMFLGCSSLITIPQLNTSSVTNMTQMFYECSSLTTIPLLNTPNVTRMYYMFLGCSSLIIIPQLNTSHVTDMFGMFSSCTSLTSIPQLDTSSVTQMRAMFYGCSSLTTIPQLDISSVTNINNFTSVFDGCTSLSNESLNNILYMCAHSAITTTSKKTLKTVGLTQAQATTCQSLSNYSAFTSAGWTTGY